MKRTVFRTMTLLLCALLCLNTALAENSVTAKVPAPGGADMITLTGLEIGGVENPTVGEELDQTAVVTSAESVTWEIPVYWLSQTTVVKSAKGTSWKIPTYQMDQMAVTTSTTGIAWEVPSYWLERSDRVVDAFSPDGMPAVALEGVIYRPVLAFYLPEGYTCDGIVTLDDDLSGVFRAMGNAVAFSSEAGITFITCTMEIIAPAIQGTQDVSGSPKKTARPVEPELPEESEDPYKKFAAAYTADHNVDIEAVFDSFGGVENTDWDALVRAFSYRDAKEELAFIVSDFNQQLMEYLKNDWGAWGEYNNPITDAVMRYKNDELEKVPASLRAYCDENTCLFVDPESLEDLKDTIVNSIQPQAVNLLRERLPVIANAADNEMSKETGLYFIYRDTGTADTDILSDEDGFKSRIRIYIGNMIEGEKDGRELLDFRDEPDRYTHAIIHEDVHLFMSDYNRNGMFPDLDGYEREMVIDYDNWTVEYFYTIPGSDDRMTQEEYRAFLDSLMFPSWMKEGTAQLIAGFYQMNYSEDLFNRVGTEKDGYLVFTPEKVKAQYDGEIGELDTGGPGEEDAKYCYAPLAMMYLTEKQLQSQGKTGLIRDESGAVIGLDNAALREGISEILDAMHTEKTLDDVIESILGPGNNADGFAKQFITDGGESLDFSVDVLNCLQAQSEALGYRVSGGILYDGEHIPLNAIDWDNSTEQSDFYQFSASGDYVYSDVPLEIAEATKTKGDFDLEEYRAQHAPAEEPDGNDAQLAAVRAEYEPAAARQDSGSAVLPENAEQPAEAELPEDAEQQEEEIELPETLDPQQDGDANQAEEPELKQDDALDQPEERRDEQPETEEPTGAEMKEPAFAGSEDKSAGSGAVQPSTEVQALEETDEA